MKMDVIVHTVIAAAEDSGPVFSELHDTGFRPGILQLETQLPSLLAGACMAVCFYIVVIRTPAPVLDSSTRRGQAFQDFTDLLAFYHGSSSLSDSDWACRMSLTRKSSSMDPEL